MNPFITVVADLAKLRTEFSAVPRRLKSAIERVRR